MRVKLVVVLAFVFCFVCSTSGDLSQSFFISLGGIWTETGSSVQQTSDSGYIVSGTTLSFEVDQTNILLARFYPNRTLDWVVTLGGSENEDGRSVQQTFDGGFIVAGETMSYGVGYRDIILAKFHSSGSFEFATILGGSDDDNGYSVRQTLDGGYIVTGYATSYGSGSKDVILAKYYSNGSLDWVRTIQLGVGLSCGRSVRQTSDGGYVVAGYSHVFGDYNIALYKFYSNGSLDWATVVYGGSVDSNLANSVQQTLDGGYILTGFTYSFGGGGSDVILAKFYSNGSLEWATAFGGAGDDQGYSVQQTFPDGGYIVTGETYSFGAGDRDALLAKFYPDGSLDWAKVLGGADDEAGFSVQQTFDGGYVVSGFTHSFGGGSEDILLAKVDRHGNSVMLTEDCPSWVDIDPQVFVLDDDIISSEYYSTTVLEYQIEDEYVFPDFQRIGKDEIDVGLECNVYTECYGVYGGIEDSETCSGNGDCTSNGTCNCYQNYFDLNCNITKCDGFFSNDSEVCGGHGVCGGFDQCEDCFDEYFGQFCEVRLYPSFIGVFGGTGVEEGKQVQQTFDGGYIVIGCTCLTFGSSFDILLSKLYSDGTLDWAITLGGSYVEKGNSVQQTSDGGYFLTGETNSYGFGDADVFLCKLFHNGTLEFATTLGGNYDDIGYSVQQTLDGGYIVTGCTKSYGVAFYDVLLAKFQSNGTLEWAITLGGDDNDYGMSVQQTFDGGYVVAGYSRSFGVGFENVALLLKIDSDRSLGWAKKFAGSEPNPYGELGFSVQQTLDGGYILAGSTDSFGAGGFDVLLAKFYPHGSLEFAVTLGGSDDDQGYSVQQTFPDGGYIVTGETYSFGAGERDVLVAKFFSNGSLDWASTYGGSDYDDYGRSVQQTFEGGYVITGMAESFGAGEDVFLGKLYSDGKGCDDFIRIPSIVSEFIDEIDVVSAIDDLDHQDHSGSFSVGFIDPNLNFVSGGLSYLSVCSIEFACFGTAVESNVCSAGGNCTGVNECICESNYFGEECEVNVCYGYFSNDTSRVCGGHGDCIDYENCECDTNYTVVEDCSFWTCFGKWKNDSYVCHGEIGGGIESHGVCTSHDRCTCEEGYQQSLSCDWECYGDALWEEEACGLYGNCIDYDICNCTTTYYAGDYCDIPTCASVSSLDTEMDVCSGHGDCVSPDVCDCELGYRMIEPGFCDWFTCFGIYWGEEDEVCEGKGECVSSNLCSCKDSFEGEECETWRCGLDKDDPKTCSGNGKCIGPSDCTCDYGFKGDLCETNILYGAVMVPTFSVAGLMGLIVFLIVVFCCCICCCCVYCCCVCLVSGLLSYLLCQTFRWKRFSKLKNIDILLQEQQADESTDIARIKINTKLFEIPIKELKVERVIGDGGSNSTVFLATWKNKKVAYKCFKTRLLCSSQESFDEFEKEAEIFCSISHPNVLAFFGCTMDPPRVGIVMEFCEKGECLKYIGKYEDVNGVRYPMEERFRMLYEICCAMEYLHSRKIIHRDLKCENVLLNRLEQCKVMDFGLSKISDKLSKQVTKGIGTPYYMAPELTSGKSLTYDEKCDVFSFSILVFLLITGLEKPYPVRLEESNRIEYMVANDPNLRPDVSLMRKVLDPEDYWIVGEVIKCWSHSPEKRPSFVDLSQIFIQQKHTSSYSRREVVHLIYGDDNMKKNKSEKEEDNGRRKFHIKKHEKKENHDNELLLRIQVKDLEDMLEEKEAELQANKVYQKENEILRKRVEELEKKLNKLSEEKRQ